MMWIRILISFFFGLLLGVFIPFVITQLDSFNCGPDAERRIDVSYPPGIRIGLTGPWNKNTDYLDRSVFNI